MAWVLGMATRALLVLAALGASAAASAAPADEAAFTREMAERFRAALPDRTVEVTAPLEIRIGGGEEPAQVNLGRVFNFCASASPEACEESRARFVGAMGGALRDIGAPIAREQLRIALRHTDFCRELERTATPAGQTEARPAPAPGLCMVLMADYPDRMRGVQANELAALGLDPAAAWALAERQTLADLPKPDEIDIDAGLIAIPDLDYGASLLLAADAWRRASRGGEVLLAVPADNFVLVARRSKIGELEAFRAAVRQSFDEAERGISPLVYRWTEAGWVPAE